MKKGYVIPLREKFAYGSGDLAVNLAFDSINFYMLWFIVSVAGIPAGVAGLIFMIARIWDAATDYFMGRISDNTSFALGRRRPYIIFGAVPMGLFFMALWYVPDAGLTGRFAYYLAIYLLFNTAYTVVSVPYGSLMAQMTQNFNERTVLSSFRVGFSFVGSLFAAAGIPLIVDVIFASRPAESSYLFMGIIFGITMMVILLMTGSVSKERVEGDRRNYDTFFKTIGSFFKLKEFRQVAGMYLFNAIGSGVIMALSIFFISDVLKVGDDAAVFMAIPLVTAVAFAPFWTLISNRFGKRNAYIWGAILTLVVLGCVFIVPAKQILIISVFLFFVGIALSALQIIPMSLLPDVIDIDEYENHIRREGAFNGLILFLHKASSGLAVGGVGMLIGLFGYTEAPPTVSAEDISQPDSALTAIRVTLALIPALCFIIAIIFTNKLDVSEGRFNGIIKELERRNRERT
ncbi:putative 2,3-dihydroxypropane-1-sulfonate exporter [Lentibacillus sp. JNUCC-1]|uniref:MFS transporter n=1 Tax=Lentibacillus sp. JNUCC-1 TaxID=2654513 RepID=UPI0012E8D8C0|nr:glycoside-pentoside-hexuronide (GPH):cation symporter [Lentibacillus sp. JNUCC-1]MUV36883.1 putative 2,3-dihydroxypropane-1-sulfonate exporter [Lentibacillus sp. JNUCC-1]